MIFLIVEDEVIIVDQGDQNGLLVLELILQKDVYEKLKLELDLYFMRDFLYCKRDFYQLFIVSNKRDDYFWKIVF